MCIYLYTPCVFVCLDKVEALAPIRGQPGPGRRWIWVAKLICRCSLHLRMPTGRPPGGPGKSHSACFTVLQ